jgi:hypothetical protein
MLRGNDAYRLNIMGRKMISGIRIHPYYAIRNYGYVLNDPYLEMFENMQRSSYKRLAGEFLPNNGVINRLNITFILCFRHDVPCISTSFATLHLSTLKF